MVFFVFFDQMCTTLLICISNHAFLVCFKYKCHIINFLLTSLAQYVHRNIGPRSFFTNLWCTKKTSVRYFSVQTSRSLGNKKTQRRPICNCSILFYFILFYLFYFILFYFILFYWFAIAIDL